LNYTRANAIHVRTLKSDTLLLLTSIIWGFAFVAQRVGMDYVGPFAFNGVRFALGSLSLLPLVLITRKKGNISPIPSIKILILGGSLAGLALFMGASLQQIGIIYTTAGKAGFITGLYVILVPILGIFLKQRTEIGTWIGAILAAIGLYFLSITAELTIAFGDLLQLIGAFFWAGHVHIIGQFSRKISPIKLAFFQFITCSILSLITAMFVEVISLQKLFQAGIPILYGGVLSVGVAYTLQVVAQRDAHPAHAAILLSLEAVFAVVGGWIVLDETLSLRGFLGCTLMLAGMLLSQFNIKIEHISRLFD
jgi:drug/metabolite transporter (DMT)-like permease